MYQFFFVSGTLLKEKIIKKIDLIDCAGGRGRVKKEKLLFHSIAKFLSKEI